MTKNAFPLAMILLLAATAAPVASAQEDGTDLDWREEVRQLRIEETATSLTFVSERTTELGDDRLDVFFEQETGRLEYRFTSFDGDDTRLRMAFDVDFVALVEFRDPQGEGRYTPDAEVLARHTLGELEPDSLTSEPILQGRGYQAHAEYTIRDQRDDDHPLSGAPTIRDGTLRLEMRMVETPRNIDGDPHVPTQLHIDVQINNHPYTAIDSHLALEMHVKSLQGSSFSPTTGIEQHADPFLSSLRWDPTATTRAGSHEVRPTVLSTTKATDQQEFRLWTAYPQSGEIDHSWSLQTDRLDLPEQIRQFLRGNALVFTGALLATLVFAGWPVMNRLRER